MGSARILNATFCSMTMRSSSAKPLTPLQHAILDFIWANENATADQVREAIKRNHPLKESSVRTLLSRLEASGYLTHTVQGKTFIYRAAAPRKQIAASAVRSITTWPSMVWDPILMRPPLS